MKRMLTAWSQQASRSINQCGGFFDQHQSTFVLRCDSEEFKFPVCFAGRCDAIRGLISILAPQ